MAKLLYLKFQNKQLLVVVQEDVELTKMQYASDLFADFHLNGFLLREENTSSLKIAINIALEEDILEEELHLESFTIKRIEICLLPSPSILKESELAELKKYLFLNLPWNTIFEKLKTE